VIASQTLRTVHRISVPYHGVPGKGGALRILFTAADLLQARAVALLDASVTSVTPDWPERLARPVLRREADFVAPLFDRHGLDAPLVTQLVRPLMRAAYGRRVAEPVASEFGCSGAFAMHCLGEDVWEAPLAQFGIDIWLTADVLAGGFPVGEVRLGPRVQAGPASRPSLPELFRQVVGSLLQCLDRHGGSWLERVGSEPLPRLGGEPVRERAGRGSSESTAGVAAPPPEPPSIDPGPLAEQFRSGTRDLAPLLEGILPGETAAAVRGLAEGDGLPHYPDDLWASTVVEFAGAYHHGVMHRDHLLGALVPLYLGRVASFAAENQGRDAAAVQERVEQIGVAFEARKPRLAELWKRERGGEAWPN
jgi:hypothetical protein